MNSRFNLSSDRSRRLWGVRSSERYQNERKEFYFQLVWLFSDFWNFVFVIFSKNNSVPTRKPDFHHLAIQRCGREIVEKHNNSPIIIAMMMMQLGHVRAVGTESRWLKFQVHPTDPPISPPVHCDRVFHIETLTGWIWWICAYFSCLRSAGGLACVPNTKRNSSDPFPNTFDSSFGTKPSIIVITPVFGAFRIRNVSRNVSRQHSEILTVIVTVVFKKAFGFPDKTAVVKNS